MQPKSAQPVVGSVLDSLQPRQLARLRGVVSGNCGQPAVSQTRRSVPPRSGPRQVGTSHHSPGYAITFVTYYIVKENLFYVSWVYVICIMLMFTKLYRRFDWKGLIGYFIHYYDQKDLQRISKTKTWGQYIGLLKSIRHCNQNKCVNFFKFQPFNPEILFFVKKCWL